MNIKPPSIKHILSRPPVTVSIETVLVDVIKLMRLENVTAAVVTNDKLPIGIVTERDVLRTLSTNTNKEINHLIVGKIMSSPPVVATPSMDFFDAYHLCSIKNIRHLIVVNDQGELYGLASESDFLRILGVDVLSSDSSIANNMISVPLLLAPNTSLQDVIRRINAESGGAAIATENGKAVGILTERDAMSLVEKPVSELVLADVMSGPVISISFDSSVYYAIDQMRIHEVRHLVIVNQDGCIVGLFTEHDVVKRIEKRYINFLSSVIKKQMTDLKEARNQLDDSVVLTSILRESLDMALIATDVGGVVRYLNPDAASMLNISPVEAVGKELQLLASMVGLDEVFIQNGIEAASRGERFQAELNRDDNLGVQVLRSSCAPIVDKDTAILGCVQMLQDITKHKQANEVLQQHASVFKNTHEGIMVTDTAGNITAVNPAFESITGFSEDEVIGKNPRILSSKRQDAEFYQRMWHHIKRDGYWQGEIWNRRKGGEFYAEWLTISAIKDDDGAILQYIGVFADITSLKHSQEEYKFLAHHDPLTGLPNRLLCQALLDHALQRIERNDSGIGVMMIDIDNFKLVNDTFGHQTGDLLLKEIAKRITVALRNDDTVARLGGDEFVVLLESVSDREDVERVAEKLVQTLSEDYDLYGNLAKVSASIGIAVVSSSQEQLTTEMLLKQADDALYEVKANGRNGYRFYQRES